MPTPNIPDYPGGQPWYLSSVNHALFLDDASGNVCLRTGFQGNIVIQGNVNIPGNVDAHISEIGTSGNLAVPWMPISIDGNANVNATVTGTVAVSSLPAITGNVAITGGNVNAAISGNVNIGTMPAISGNVAITGGNINAAVTGNVTVVDGGGSITVDGNVGITGTVNANITGGNVTVQQGTSPWVVSGNVGITGSPVVTLSGTNLDAFARLRVSNPHTLFDSRNMYIDGEQFSTIIAGAGTRNYVQAESSFNLAVTTASGDSVIVQSKTTQSYQPGKSLLALCSFAAALPKANLRQRIGYFTTNNGIFFEIDGTTLNLLIRSSASGVLVEERIPQSSWNGDKLNGTGASGLTLDPTLTQIWWTDIEWLGVGNVRVGFVINGNFIVCHTFQHANISGNTRVYMTTATLNPRYEITNTGTTSAPSNFKQICCTVISEGGYTPSSKINYVPNGVTVTRVSDANTITSLCSVRLNPAYPDAVVIPAQIDLLLTDVRYGVFQLVENATIANAVWSNVANSVVQTAIHTDTITDGKVVYSGLTSSRDTLVVDEDLQKRLQLWRHANGTPSTLTLAVAYTNTNADLLYKLGWQENT